MLAVLLYRYPMHEENPQSKGGFARKESLSPEKRKEIATAAAIARWKGQHELQDPGRIPEALRQGVLQIGDVGIDCYHLDNGKRVIHKRGMARALCMKSMGGNVFMRTMNRKGLGSVIPENVWEKINNPLIFKPLSGDPGHGYEATDMIDVCAAILDAAKAGKLRPNQKFLEIQAEIIIRASAKLGIVALIDEATGYIADKRKEEYREMFRDFLRVEAGKYDSEFPDQFFDIIYKLYKLPRGKIKNRHPQFFGHFIRRYIYEPLANSHGAILEMLDEKNPVVYVNGGRRYKMFHFLSEVVGLNALRAHMWQTVGIGNSVNTKTQFDRAFLNAFPALNLEPELPLVFDE